MAAPNNNNNNNNTNPVAAADEIQNATTTTTPAQMQPHLAGLSRQQRESVDNRSSGLSVYMENIIMGKPVGDSKEYLELFEREKDPLVKRITLVDMSLKLTQMPSVQQKFNALPQAEGAAQPPAVWLYRLHHMMRESIACADTLQKNACPERALYTSW